MPTVANGILASQLAGHTSYGRPLAMAILEVFMEACAASTDACERMIELYDPWNTCSIACRRVTDALSTS
jgi:hypothetical protein